MKRRRFYISLQLFGFGGSPPLNPIVKNGVKKRIGGLMKGQMTEQEFKKKVKGLNPLQQMALLVELITPIKKFVEKEGGLNENKKRES